MRVLLVRHFLSTWGTINPPCWNLPHHLWIPLLLAGLVVQDPPTKHKQEKSAWNSLLAVSCTKYKEQHILCPNNADRMETIQGNSLCSDRPPGEKGARNCLQRAFNRASIGEEAMLPSHWGGGCICGNHLLNSRWCLENCAAKWAGRTLFWERCCRSYVQNEQFMRWIHL